MLSPLKLADLFAVARAWGRECAVDGLAEEEISKGVSYLGELYQVMPEYPLHDLKVLAQYSEVALAAYRGAKQEKE